MNSYASGSQSDFDVVVIGAGAAGCPVAYQLVRHGLRTCLVEAGPDYGPASSSSWPAELLDASRFPRTHDWQYDAEVTPHEATPEPRARVVGGCSAHNQCAAVWPIPADFDRWAEISGDAGWSYKHVRPLIDEIEDAAGGDRRYRGHGGLLPTRPWADHELASWQLAFVNGARQAGHDQIEDIASPEPPTGVTTFQVNVRGSTRWNSAFAFLDPVRDRAELAVVDGLLAERLEIDQRKASALVCRDRDGGRVAISARHFVLSAGVYGTPTMLLRSGVGPERDLRRMGIRSSVDLPGVGRNLHDHAGVSVSLEPSDAGLAALAEDETTGSFDQSQSVLRIWDPALHVLPYHGRSGTGGWTHEILLFAMRPRSRGFVTIRNGDARTPPVIVPGWLADPMDVESLRRGLLLVQPLLRAPAIARLAGGRKRQLLDVQELVRPGQVGGYGHAVGTCRMGPEAERTSVADSSGRVYGLDNVTIADVSLLPEIPAANTNLTAMLVGWRISNLLASDLAQGV